MKQLFKFLLVFLSLTTVLSCTSIAQREPSCSLEVSGQSKLLQAKETFMKLLATAQKPNKILTEQNFLNHNIRKWDYKVYTKEASQKFIEKFLLQAQKIGQSYQIITKEGELVHKEFDARDHSAELRRYYIKIRNSQNEIFEYQMMCQSTYNCLNDQDARSACYLEEK